MVNDLTGQFWSHCRIEGMIGGRVRYRDREIWDRKIYREKDKRRG